MTTPEKLAKCIYILSGLTPRVDQVGTIAQPIAGVVNELIDIKNELIDLESKAEGPVEH